MLATPSPTPLDEGFCNLIHIMYRIRHDMNLQTSTISIIYSKKGLLLLLMDNGPQYLAILNFTEDDLLKLETSGLRRELPGFRVLLDEENKTAIIKLMPGIPHEVAKVISEEIFLENEQDWDYQETYLFLPVQEDISSQMSSTRKGPGHFPSFIVEVGVSQSLLQLRQDALARYISSTKKGSFWEPLFPEKVEVVTYDNNTQQVTGDPLILPIKLLLDVVPSHVPSSEISIGRQELLSYGIDLFDGLQ
ncbi:hypothetical protein V1522DRAFT_448460 [Lipomyces starkeyi]